MRFPSIFAITICLLGHNAYSQTSRSPNRSPSPESSTAAADEIRAVDCFVKFIRNIQVPAQVEGQLTSVAVDEGMVIDEGDVLAVIDDTAAKLALELKLAEEKEAMLNAANDVQLRDARNSEELAVAEAESYRELHEQGAVPFYEFKKKLLESARATLKIELAEMQKKIAGAQYIAKRSEREIAEYETTRRNIKAPFSGYVENRFAQLGEWVQPGSPIVELVQLDRLRVEGNLNALSSAGKVTPGTPVQVKIYNAAGGGEPLTIDGEIGFVSSKIDFSGEYRVWVEIENRRIGDDWAIKPGMKAEIIVKPQPGT